MEYSELPQEIKRVATEIERCDVVLKRMSTKDADEVGISGCYCQANMGLVAKAIESEKGRLQVYLAHLREQELTIAKVAESLLPKESQRKLVGK